MKSLLKMTWMEIKLFMREPIGAFFTLGFPLMMLFLFGSIYGNEPSSFFGGRGTIDISIPAYTAMIIATSGLMSITITMASYCEKGVLRRLRTTPVSPLIILAAQVIVVFIMTLLGMILLMAAGKLVYHVQFEGNILSVFGGFVLGSLSFFGLGFILAGVMPNARSAQIVGMVLLYPMMFLSGAVFRGSSFPNRSKKLRHTCPSPTWSICCAACGSVTPGERICLIWESLLVCCFLAWSFQPRHSDGNSRLRVFEDQAIAMIVSETILVDRPSLTV